MLLITRIVLAMEIAAVSIALRDAQANCRKLTKEQQTQRTSIDTEQESTFVSMSPDMGAKRAGQIFQ
jgi:hypothetical protein